jgi:enoyl-CoA hydratase/carnithine racemase
MPDEAMANYNTLTLTLNDDTAWVTLSRPSVRNALSPETLEEIIAAMGVIDGNPDIRVAVLQGDGPAFSVGFDLNAMAALVTNAGALDEENLRSMARLGQEAVDAVGACRAVTIASVHGYAIGGGFLLMAACDFRIAADDTRFSIPEVDIGIPLLWGGVPRLVYELGPSLAKELIMTCRRFGVSELATSRFIHQAVSAADRPDCTAQLVDELCARPTYPLRETKAQFEALRAAYCDGLPPDEERFVSAVLHPDFLATAMAYVQQRLNAKK